jgi:hypothetical protein
MNEDYSERARHPSADKKVETAQYTAKDFQLEVLGRLGEMQDATAALEESWNKKLESFREQRSLTFDSRTLLALGALVLSTAGYVIEDARNGAKQASEIEATKARVVLLEQIAATNSEVRIRTEVQLSELRDVQVQIKTLIQAHDKAGKKE